MDISLNQIFTTNDAEFVKLMSKRIKSKLNHKEIQEVFETYISQQIARAKLCKTVEDVNMYMHSAYMLKLVRKEIYGY